jgi:hypothetical protein
MAKPLRRTPDNAVCPFQPMTSFQASRCEDQGIAPSPGTQSEPVSQESYHWGRMLCLSDRVVSR